MSGEHDNFCRINLSILVTCFVDNVQRVTLIFFFYCKELTSQKEKDFLTVLSMIKNKDPKIYEKDSNFYHEDGMVKDA